MTKSAYQFAAAWKYLLSIQDGGGGQYGFDDFFTAPADKQAAKYLLAERQDNGVFALFCEDFFVEEVDTKNLAEAKKCFRSVLDDIVARRGEWKNC